MPKRPRGPGGGHQAEAFGLELNVIAAVSAEQYRHGDIFTRQSVGQDRADLGFDRVTVTCGARSQGSLNPLGKVADHELLHASDAIIRAWVTEFVAPPRAKLVSKPGPH